MGNSKGLYLFVQPTGGKLWRQDYRFQSKRKTLALDSSPEVRLILARDKRDDARKLLAADIDPSESKKPVKASAKGNALNSFEVVAREWISSHMANKAESHREKVLRRFELYLFPWIGSKPISDITAPEVLHAIKRIYEHQN